MTESPADLLATEHRALLGSARGLVEDLLSVEERLQHGEAMYFEHMEFAERLRSLALYLSAALRLVEEALYAPAFGSLRSALEHHLLDRVMLLGRWYVQTVQGAKKKDFEDLLRRQREGDPALADARLEYKTGRLRIVRYGIRPEGRAGTGGRTISLLHFLIQDFDPMVGGPDEQLYLASQFTEVALHKQHAAQQQRIYRMGLRWDGMKDNLSLNRLASQRTLRQLEVHYRFLSAFTHPNSTAAFDLLHGHNRPSIGPAYDHFASELALLYVNHIASDALSTFKKMADREPKVGISAWDATEVRVADARQLAAHMWWPGTQPDWFDRIQEANSRGIGPRRTFVPREQREPDKLKPEQVHYYRDPLRRLVRMHQSSNEVTGFAYRSPWPRPDPLRR